MSKKSVNRSPKRLFRFSKMALIASVILLSAGLQRESRAALIGSDNASNSAYSPGWTSGTNGGSGFGAWSMSPTPNTSFYGTIIADSTTNAGSGTGAVGSSGGINTTGSKSWGMYANTSNLESAVRPFSADSTGATALTAGQTLSFAFDNGNISSGNSTGISLQTTSGTTLFEFFFVGGNSFYTIHDNSGMPSSGIGFTGNGLTFSFTDPTPSTYSVVITPNGGTAKTFTGTLIGSPSSYSVGRFRLYNSAAGSGTAYNSFANSLSITKPVISLTNSAPSGYGSSQGTLTVTGNNGNYTTGQLTGLSASTGYAAITGFNPTTDTELVGLDVQVSGQQASGSQISALVADIGASASATSPSPAFGSGYNLFLTLNASSVPVLPTGSQPYYLGFDFGNDAQNSVGNVTISSLEIVPEPVSFAMVAAVSLAALVRRRAKA